MIDLTKVNKIYLYPGRTDFRKGINGLLNLIDDNKSHNLYIFANVKCTSIKIIEIEDNAIWLYQKKLLKNRFLFPKDGDISVITSNEIESIINGIDIVNKIENVKSKKNDLF